MKLHKLTYSKAKIKDAGDYSFGEFFVVLDGINDERFIYDISAIELSLKKSGIYPILNCSCGEFGCGGFYVEVKHAGDKIIWQKIWITPPDLVTPNRPLKGFDSIHFKNNREIDLPIAFSKPEYAELVAELMQKKVDQTRILILELCSESEYGSWEFWLGKEKTEEECMHIVKALADLVRDKLIFPVEHKSIIDRTYQEVPLDISRLENEVRRSMTPYNLDPDNFYWFVATEEGEKQDFEVRTKLQKLRN